MRYFGRQRRQLDIQRWFQHFSIQNCSPLIYFMVLVLLQLLLVTMTSLQISLWVLSLPKFDIDTFFMYFNSTKIKLSTLSTGVVSLIICLTWHDLFLSLIVGIECVANVKAAGILEALQDPPGTIGWSKEGTRDCKKCNFHFKYGNKWFPPKLLFGPNSSWPIHYRTVPKLLGFSHVWLRQGTSFYHFALIYFTCLPIKKKKKLV